MSCWATITAKPARPCWSTAVERWLPAQGLRVQRNQPYAGGFTTQRYGRPGVGRHALQIEINRALYMDEARHTKLPTFGAIERLMTGLLDEIGDRARSMRCCSPAAGGRVAVRRDRAKKGAVTSTARV